MPKVHYKEFLKPFDLNGYYPRNNKLLTFPFCYLVLSNNLGVSNILYYEKFVNGDTCKFEICGIPTPRCFN